VAWNLSPGRFSALDNDWSRTTLMGVPAGIVIGFVVSKIWPITPGFSPAFGLSLAEGFWLLHAANSRARTLASGKHRYLFRFNM
jgi:hypothetical protein